MNARAAVALAGCRRTTRGPAPAAGDRAPHARDSGRVLPRVEPARRHAAAHRQSSATVKSAFSAAIQANFTPGASRRRPRLFLGCRAPCAARDSLCGAGPAPRARRVVSPVRPCVRSARARSTHSRSADSVRSRSRATAPTALALVEHQPDGLRLELVSELPARPALGCVCHRSGHRIHLSEDVHANRIKPSSASERSSLLRRRVGALTKWALDLDTSCRPA